MHQLWTIAAGVIAMLWLAGAGEARERPPQRTADAPPIPYRLDGLSDAPAPAPPGAAKAPPEETAPNPQAPPQGSATGVIRNGYYYPPPLTVTTVIEHRRH